MFIGCTALQTLRNTRPQENNIFYHHLKVTRILTAILSTVLDSGIFNPCPDWSLALIKF